MSECGIPTVTSEQLALVSLVNPIKEAIYMHDRGQPCVCSEQGKCYMHAQIERAEAALEELEGRATRPPAAEEPA